MQSLLRLPVFFLKLPCCTCIEERASMMGSAMGQTIPCGRSPPALCFLHRILESTGFCVAISDHAVLLKDQSDVVIIGTPEPLFQPQTLATGFHIVAFRRF